MGFAREETVEISSPPRFMPGAKVRAVRTVKNDGTYPHREIGDILVRKGDIGYVRDIGTFLQRFYVCAVEFVERGAVVGMRGYELAPADQAETAAPARDASVQEPAA
jgi:nitrogen fixation protein NifZ